MARYETDLTTRDRFQIWISDPNDETRNFRVHRIELMDFRRQIKGLGGGSAVLLQTQIVSDTGPDRENEFDERTIIKEGMYIKIVDSYILDDNVTHDDIVPQDNPECIVFFGYISSITSDVFEGKRNSIGSISFNEIGWKLKDEMCNLYFSEDGAQLSNPPDFNQSINGIIYGNRKNDENKFSNDDYVKTVNGSWPSGYDELKVWNRQQIIEVITASSALALEVSIPDVSGAAPTYFTETKYPRSYPSFNNKPIMKALDDLTEDPLIWNLDYTTSGSSIVLKFGMSANVSIDGYPEPDVSTVNLSGSSLDCVNLNVTKTAQKADKVTVRGAPILCCGGFTPWIQDNQQGIERDWDEKVELAYVNGNSTDATTPITDAADGDRYRSTIPDVYRKFKLKKFEDLDGKLTYVVPAKVGSVDGFAAEAPEVEGDRAKFAFCPKFIFEDDDGEILDTPIIQKNYRTNSNHHSTPHPLNTRWAKKLPLFRSLDLYIDGTDYTLSENDLLDPMVIIPTIDETDEENEKKIFYLDTIAAGSLGNPIKNKVEFIGDTIKLSTTPAPQAYAWENVDLFEGGISSQMNSFWRSGAGATAYNPNDGAGLPQMGGKSHWARFIIIGALYADQFLEISKTGEYWTISGWQPITTPKNHVIIEDPDLQLWFVHDGTPLDFDYQTELSSGTMFRKLSDGFTRNDLPRAKEILNTAWEWLSKTKRAMHMEFLINKNTFTTYKIGTVLSSISDRPNGDPLENDASIQTYEINTAISSVSYEGLNTIEPHIVISTEIPKMPGLKKIIYGGGSGTGSSGINFDGARNYKNNQVKNKNYEPKDNSTTSVGVVSYSGGSVASEAGNTLIVAKVLGGNSSEFADGVYSPYTTSSYSMDLYDDNNNIKRTPKVEDWTKLDLDDEYTIGNNFTRAPNGICYLQLLRPHSLGSSSWDANIEAGIEALDSDDFYANKFIFAEDKQTILINFTQKDIRMKEGLSPSDFTVVVRDASKNIVSPAVRITNVGLVSDTQVGVVLERPLDADTETATISFGQVVIADFPDENDPNITVSVMNDEQSVTDVAFSGDKYTVVFGLNRNGTQTYNAGDIVLVDTEEFSVTDDNSVARICYDIVGPCSSAQFHDHSSYAGDGLGPSSVNIGSVD